MDKIIIVGRPLHSYIFLYTEAEFDFVTLYRLDLQRFRLLAHRLGDRTFYRVFDNFSYRGTRVADGVVRKILPLCQSQKKTCKIFEKKFFCHFAQYLEF